MYKLSASTGAVDLSARLTGMAGCSSIISSTSSSYTWLLWYGNNLRIIKLDSATFNVDSAIKFTGPAQDIMSLEKLSMLDTSEEFIWTFSDTPTDYVLFVKVDFSTTSITHQMEVKSLLSSTGTNDRVQRVIGKFIIHALPSTHWDQIFCVWVANLYQIFFRVGSLCIIWPNLFRSNKFKITLTFYARRDSHVYE